MLGLDFRVACIFADGGGRGGASRQGVSDSSLHAANAMLQSPSIITCFLRAPPETLLSRKAPTSYARWLTGRNAAAEVWNEQEDIS